MENGKMKNGKNGTHWKLKDGQTGNFWKHGTNGKLKQGNMEKMGNAWNKWKNEQWTNGKPDEFLK